MGDNPLPQPSNASMSSGTYPSIPINSEGFLPSQLLDSFASTLELQSSPEKTSDQGWTSHITQGKLTHRKALFSNTKY